MQDYERVVRQRNALLKSLRMGADREKWDAVLQPWDDQLIELGVRIMLARRSVVSALALPIRSSYRALVESDHRPSIRILESALLTEGDVSRETFDSDEGGSMGLIAPEEPRDRKPSEDSEVSNSTVSRETLSEAFRAQLSSVRSKEVERGASLIGPHRDDLLLELNGLPVKGYASHGETWSFVLSMKLALAEAIRLDASNGDPVLLLDDVFAELDEGRRERLISAVGGYEQIIVTTAVEGDVPASLVGHRVDVHEGRAIERDQSLR